MVYQYVETQVQQWPSVLVNTPVLFVNTKRSNANPSAFGFARSATTHLLVAHGSRSPEHPKPTTEFYVGPLTVQPPLTWPSLLKKQQ